MVSGTVGRGMTNGYSPYRGTNVSGTLSNIGGNAYPAGNAGGGSVDIYDLMDDNFDHTGLGFIGGSQIGVGGDPGGGPGNITFPGGGSSARMGAQFQTNQKNQELQTKTIGSATP